jgi:hypothetical protein
MVLALEMEDVVSRDGAPGRRATTGRAKEVRLNDAFAHREGAASMTFRQDGETSRMVASDEAQPTKRSTRTSTSSGRPAIADGRAADASPRAIDSAAAAGRGRVACEQSWVPPSPPLWRRQRGVRAVLRRELRREQFCRAHVIGRAFRVGDCRRHWRLCCSAWSRVVRWAATLRSRRVHEIDGRRVSAARAKRICLIAETVDSSRAHEML